MNYNYKRKQHFRPAEEKRKHGKQARIGLHLGLLLGLAGLWATPGTSAPTDTNVDPAALHAQLQGEITRELSVAAERYQWQDYRAAINITLPTSVKHLPACDTPIVIAAADQQSQPIGNLKRKVSCQSGPQTWELNTTVSVALTLPVLVAKSTINRDTKIDATMLSQQTLTFRHDKAFATQPQQVIGRLATRRIRTGQVISPTYLERLWLVEKGEEVLIIASKHGMQATTKGIARENGAQGEQISVQNQRSAKVIRAIVSDRGKVRTIF
ncbi:flagellar basal body P-ring formation chaperone FlgA [Photobacterium sp. MCCC 1A19761]|uniref:flagellar basal body P-ring formation chaperone FlgA n=1 Tax=Photobacterium sp. MCCC 1A19761 TaxID=3115000 RepID=UPI00307DD70B